MTTRPEGVAVFWILFGIASTSTATAPWHVVPADHKWFARVVIGSAIVSALDKLNLHFPRVDKASVQEFAKVRQALLSEGKAGSKKARSKKVFAAVKAAKTAGRAKKQ